jgi:hypothetical protein
MGWLVPVFVGSLKLAFIVFPADFPVLCGVPASAARFVEAPEPCPVLLPPDTFPCVDLFV